MLFNKSNFRFKLTTTLRTSSMRRNKIKILSKRWHPLIVLGARPYCEYTFPDTYNEDIFIMTYLIMVSARLSGTITWIKFCAFKLPAAISDRSEANLLRFKPGPTCLKILKFMIHRYTEWSFAHFNFLVSD